MSVPSHDRVRRERDTNKICRFVSRALTLVVILFSVSLAGVKMAKNKKKEEIALKNSSLDSRAKQKRKTGHFFASVKGAYLLLPTFLLALVQLSFFYLVFF